MTERDPDFFKLHYRQWRQRMHKLRVPYDLQGAVLAIVIETHLNGAPPPDDDCVLAGIMMVSPRKARAVLDKLSGLGLVQIRDGQVIDKTAVEDARERSKLRAKRSRAGREGGVRSGVVRRDNADLKEPSGEFAFDKPLKINETGEAKPDEGFELEKSREESSVSSLRSDTGTKVPPDPTKVLFDSGIALLGESGISKQKARPILGRWRSRHGDAAVIAALGAAQREGAIDPVAFIEKCLRSSVQSGPKQTEDGRMVYADALGGGPIIR